MTPRGSDAYLRTQILTAPPEKLQLMLYEGAIRFATQAKARIEEKNYEASYELLLRAQSVVLELMCGLRPEQNAELCGRLSAVYAFVYRRLVEANVTHEAAKIDDAVSVLDVQRGIWVELIDKLAEEHAAQPQGAVSSV
jgi:flagellar protein FliS